ncbi:MAG TPA: site-2 protease family protein [Nevskiaceae bacterium]|nr:site-2 protease family protein [Nevskiaceae bacterium]
MPDFAFLAQQIAVWAIPVLFAITVHEVAHGFVAKRLGDDTAERAGRLTLNPVRHIDPIGTIVLPLVMLIAKSPFLFGWAKPVPVDFRRLRRPVRDMALVAAAGPGSNLAMAMGWMALLWCYQAAGRPDGGWTLFRDMGIAGVSVNVVLMVLNLLPIPPLDGGRIAVSLLPRSLALPLSKVEPYGMVILIALLVFEVLGTILFWPTVFVETALYRLFAVQIGGL